MQLNLLEMDLANSTSNTSKSDKKHSFSSHTYMKKIKCDQCHEKLWGMEQRCDDCSFHCHNKCIPLVLQSCTADSQKSFQSDTAPAQVFGTSLKQLLEIQGTSVPTIVVKCIAQVEQRGMDFEGIYRKSGPLTQINRIISMVNKGEEVDFGGDSGVEGGGEWDIMAVTSVLKQFFRDLPNPLMTFELYQEFMQVCSLLRYNRQELTAKRKRLDCIAKFWHSYRVGTIQR